MKSAILFFLEVCFRCFGARTSPEDGEDDPDFGTLAAIVSELKLPLGGRTSLREVQRRWSELAKIIELQRK